MWDLKVCTVCLSTDVKLYSLNIGTLRQDFKSVSGLQMVQGSGLPDFLCVVCTAYVTKFKKFRDKCHRAHYALQKLLTINKEIKKSHISDFNRNLLNIMPKLSYMSLDRTHTIKTEFKLVKLYRNGVPLPPGLIPVAHCSILPSEVTIELDMKVTRDEEEQKEDIKTEIEQTGSYETTDNQLKIHNTADENGIDATEQNATDFNIDKQYSSRSILQRALEMANNEDSFNHTNDDRNMDNTDVEEDSFEFMSCQLTNKTDADAVTAKEDYGVVVPISFKDARAAYEVLKFVSFGQYRCDCGRRYESKICYDQHCQRHNKLISGPLNGVSYRCEICDIYFRSASLRESHMSLNHMYKYLCRLCPEVMFSNKAARLHYIIHAKGSYNTPWAEGQRPSWLRKERKRKNKTEVIQPSPQKPKKLYKKKLPKDFLVYAPQRQEDQYLLIQQRKETRNYLEAKFRCELCYRGYRLTTTYNKHMQKHDSTISGSHQCDMCKHYFRNTRSLYKHMNMYHLNTFTCQYCEFVTTNKGQAYNHYKWHKNVTYDCPHCDKKFNKLSTRLTHIRFKHPGTDICNICGHSFVSSSGLNCHKVMSHTKEEIEISEALTLNPDSKNQFYCVECSMQFFTELAYSTHLGSSKNHVDTNISSRSMMSNNRRISRAEGGTPSASKRSLICPDGGRGRKRLAANTMEGSTILNTGTTTATSCEVCGKFLVSDVIARRHYEAEHPGTAYLKRYMCDVCGHTTRQYANLLVHMRTHTQEKPYECPHCDRRFSMTSNRDRHLVVHTGEKRYQCQHCNRRFTQSTAVKLHIQTVHMKIPYKPWDKKNRKRRKDALPTTAGIEVTEPTPVNMAVVPVPQHKLLIDPQGDYITYISYTEEQ